MAQKNTKPSRARTAAKVSGKSSAKTKAKLSKPVRSGLITRLPKVAGCVFCRIVSGEIPAYRIFEDARTLAFMDINPFNEGHVLVIAKGHYKDIFVTPPDVLAAVAQTAQRVAKALQDVLAPEGLNIVQANGPAAGQSQHHFHVHVLPRRMNDRAKLNWDLSPGDPHAIEAMQVRVRAALKSK